MRRLLLYVCTLVTALCTGHAFAGDNRQSFEVAESIRQGEAICSVAFTGPQDKETTEAFNALPLVTEVHFISTIIISKEFVDGLKKRSDVKILTIMAPQSNYALGIFEKLPNLTEVRLYTSAFDPESLPSLDQLKTLYIENAISDSGIKWISSCRELENLSVTISNLTDESLSNLKSLTKLKKLSINGLKPSERDLVRTTFKDRTISLALPEHRSGE